MSNVNYLSQFAKSFNWAGFFLPKSVYQDCSKLYAFCRVLDDLVDEKTDLELREERFNEIKNIYKKTYDNLPLSRRLIDKKNPKVGIFDLGNHILIIGVILLVVFVSLNVD